MQCFQILILCFGLTGFYSPLENKNLYSIVLSRWVNRPWAEALDPLPYLDNNVPLSNEFLCSHFHVFNLKLNGLLQSAGIGAFRTFVNNALSFFFSARFRGMFYIRWNPLKF